MAGARRKSKVSATIMAAARRRDHHCYPVLASAQHQPVILVQHYVERGPVGFVHGIEGVQVERHDFRLILFEQRTDSVLQLGIIHLVRQILHYAFLMRYLQSIQEGDEEWLLILNQPSTD